MIDRYHIERFLQLNGVSPSAPDEEIKSILISASWHEDDIKTAIMVLRENKQSNEARVDSVHKIFHTDDKLKPETVSSMLGIEMGITSEEIALRRKARNGLTVQEVLRLIGISITLSMLSILLAMWWFDVGLFHVAAR